MRRRWAEGWPPVWAMAILKIWVVGTCNPSFNSSISNRGGQRYVAGGLNPLYVIIGTVKDGTNMLDVTGTATCRPFLCFWVGNPKF